MLKTENKPFGIYWPNDWYLAVNMCAWGCFFLGPLSIARGFNLGPLSPTAAVGSTTFFRVRTERLRDRRGVSGWGQRSGQVRPDYRGGLACRVISVATISVMRSAPGGRRVSCSRRVMRTWRAMVAAGGSGVWWRWSL
jgi:hypothetical protein